MLLGRASSRPLLHRCTRVGVLHRISPLASMHAGGRNEARPDSSEKNGVNEQAWYLTIGEKLATFVVAVTIMIS